MCGTQLGKIIILGVRWARQVPSKNTSHYLCTVPWLPKAARMAHIVPGLAHTLLVSIKTLCDAGCKVEYDDNACKVYYKAKVVWVGEREPSTRLWVLPLSNKPTRTNFQTRPPIHSANNAFAMSSKEGLIKYLHQCLFSPTKATLLKAIRNNQLTTWPGLTATAVEQHLPDSSPATDKGHMRRQRQGI